MKLIKRNGEEQDFDATKIQNAIQKANMSVEEIYRMSQDTLNEIVIAVLNSL